MANWDLVSERLQDAKGIAWDECHKIYALMDIEQVNQMREWEYPFVHDCVEMSADKMLETLQDWYERSCSLRFIDAVSTNLSDPNAGFETLIGQFEPEEEED